MTLFNYSFVTLFQDVKLNDEISRRMTLKAKMVPFCAVSVEDFLFYIYIFAHSEETIALFYAKYFLVFKILTMMFDGGDG